MANPQAEEGHIDIANEISEALMKTQLGGYESRVLWAILRKTYGWHKTSDWISGSQLVKMTGLRKQHIWRAKKQLEARNIVTISGYKITFQKDYTRWKKVTISGIVTKSGIGVTISGIRVTKNGGHKRNYTKETITKDIPKKYPKEYLLDEELLKKDYLELSKGLNVNLIDIKRKAEQIYNWTLSHKKNRRDNYKAVLKNALIKDFNYTFKS